MNVKVKVPATTANLGPGFDTLGLALNIFNYLEVSTEADELSIEITGEGAEFLAPNQNNLVYKAIQRLFEEVGQELPPLKIKQYNEIPLASGLGSSAATIVSGLVAANYLVHNPLDDDQLLALATEMEGHPDNAAPALFGGLIISGIEQDKIIYSKIKPENPPQIIVVVPEFSVSTQQARSVLPNEICYDDAVYNLSRLAFLINCFVTGDYDNFSYACQDRLHQNYRKSLVPGFDDVINASYLHGGLGAALSGAGPTVVGFAYENVELIARKMQDAFLKNNFESKVFITAINNKGICRI